MNDLFVAEELRRLERYRDCEFAQSAGADAARAGLDASLCPYSSLAKETANRDPTLRGYWLRGFEAVSNARQMPDMLKRAELAEDLLAHRNRELQDANIKIANLKRELSERPAQSPAIVPPARKRWEYYRLPHPFVPAGDGSELNYNGTIKQDTMAEQDKLNEAFSQLGADGWEFDRCYLDRYSSEFYVFRRELLAAE